MNEARAGGHGVFGERAGGDVEGFVGDEVADSGWGGAVEGWVTDGEVVAAGKKGELRKG